MIDWTGELEAFHPDGRVVHMEYGQEYRPSYQSGVMHITKSFPDGCESNEIWRADGTNNAAGSVWCIRNTQPKSPPIPDDIAARAVELVRRITESAVLKDTGWAIDARVILFDLEPVDPDIEVANAIRVDAYMSDTGSQPIDWIDTAIRNAIAKSRQMQKDGE